MVLSVKELGRSLGSYRLLIGFGRAGDIWGIEGVGHRNL